MYESDYDDDRYSPSESDLEELEFARITNDLLRLHPSEQQRLKEMLDRVLAANEEYAETESPW